jgi:hypothetical protein
LLENTVADARTIAVKGARKVLRDQYAVHHHEPWPTLSMEDRELRNQLRAYGRQLGDRRDGQRNAQEIEHLVQSCAYEHWHRLLFARFLAENDLLLDAEHGLALSLDDVQELARDQNRDWIEIAAELAERMLLSVFRPDDPVLKVVVPPETRQSLEEKLESLPAEVFRADDSLGWVYQFWQRDEKDRVNKSEVKIGADELPAVTQLFTEDYMVLFLLENTLGAWWTAKRRAEGKDPALPGYEWTYLRLNEDGSPAAGGFDGWPRSASELRVLDPSMGSGHFLTFALPILARMRMEEEGLAMQPAIQAVLRDNLHGLELDARCAQIAAFNLALAAWRLAGEHFELPELNLACSGLGIHASEADWMRLAGEDGLAREEMRRLYSLFKDAPTLGSLIDPLRLQATVYSAGAERVLPLIEEALASERASDEARELAIAARGVLAAFRILAARFTIVATNVPYLGRGKQARVLADYCAEFHAEAKADLATCFVDRCLRFCSEGGSTALVTPQNWLFLTSYKKLREQLLTRVQWDLVARLGPRAFETITGEVVNVALVALTRRLPSPEQTFAGWDVSEAGTPQEKSTELRNGVTDTTHQLEQLGNPSSRLTFQGQVQRARLGDFADTWQGLVTGDTNRFTISFWEVDRCDDEVWQWFVSSPDTSDDFVGRELLVRWEQGVGALHKDSNAHNFPPQSALGRPGVLLSQIRNVRVTRYLGEIFNDLSVPLIPHDEADLPAVYAFCTGDGFTEAVRTQTQSLQIRVGYFLGVPFDVSYWRQVAAEKYPKGLPKPHSDNPTQWLFTGHPKDSNQTLQTAAARLVGYRWPRQAGFCFPNCPAVGPDGLEYHADADGIVPLNAIGGESSAADRLRALLADAYGPAWSAGRLQELLGGSPSLEEWLRDGFFEEHCSIFHSRPFVWHVWDGRKDGFHALVNYHKLAAPNGDGKKTLEKLIYVTLGDWIGRQLAEVKVSVEGAEGRLVAALHLKAELEKILHGEPPYDLFVRWKPLHEQPIGWEPDINDGVRLNIRPWLTAKPYQPSRRDACILRVTPKIKFGKDRGKEPYRPTEDFPWFWSWDEKTEDFQGGKQFDGARWNDLHYSIAAKQAARERKGLL